MCSVNNGIVYKEKKLITNCVFITAKRVTQSIHRRYPHNNFLFDIFTICIRSNIQTLFALSYSQRVQQRRAV